MLRVSSSGALGWIPIGLDELCGTSERKAHAASPLANGCSKTVFVRGEAVQAEPQGHNLEKGAFPEVRPFWIGISHGSYSFQHTDFCKSEHITRTSDFPIIVANLTRELLLPCRISATQFAPWFFVKPLMTIRMARQSVKRCRGVN